MIKKTGNEMTVAQASTMGIGRSIQNAGGRQKFQGFAFFFNAIKCK